MLEKLSIQVASPPSPSSSPSPFLSSPLLSALPYFLCLALSLSAGVKEGLTAVSLRSLIEHEHGILDLKVGRNRALQ